MDIKTILSLITFKDWLIIVTLSILIISLIQICKLKKSLIRKVHRRLVPQLVLNIDLNDMGIFIKNIGCLIVKDIEIENLDIDIEDYGFQMHFTLKFDPIESLRPDEKVKLNFKAFHKGEETPEKSADGIIPHLISISFRLKVNYPNIKNLRFGAEYLSKGKAFLLDKIESYQ